MQDYRFIVSLYALLKTKEFKVSRGFFTVYRKEKPLIVPLKPPPHQHASSKAILSCLHVTASWLSRAKQVVKLLEEIGPDGLLPDPVVVQQLQSKALTHKGSDLLIFLKQQKDRSRVRVHALPT